MKAPRRSTVEYVYAKLKTEVITFLENEIRYNLESDGDVYGFTAEQMAIYDCLCNDMIGAIEETEVNYENLKEHFDKLDDELPW